MGKRQEGSDRSGEQGKILYCEEGEEKEAHWRGGDDHFSIDQDHHL